MGSLSLPSSGLPEAGDQLNRQDACKMMSEEARPHFRAGIGELLPVKGGAGIDDELGKNDPTIAVCVRLAVEKKQIDYFRLALAAPASAGMRARCAVTLPRSLRAGTPMRSAPWAAIVAISAQRITEGAGSLASPR